MFIVVEIYNLTLKVINCRVYEDDFEPEENDPEGTNAQEAKQKNAGAASLKKATPLRETSPKKEDIYDFASNDLGY